MANEDCVGTLRIERTISFIGKLYGGKRGAAIQRQRPGQDNLPGEAETVVVGGAQRGHHALGAKADPGGLSMEGASVARGAHGGDICNPGGAARPDMSKREYSVGPLPRK